MPHRRIHSLVNSKVLSSTNKKVVKRSRNVKGSTYVLRNETTDEDSIGKAIDHANLLSSYDNAKYDKK